MVDPDFSRTSVKSPSMIVVERLSSRVGPIENPPSIWNAPRRTTPARCRLQGYSRIRAQKARTRRCRSKNPGVSKEQAGAPASKCRQTIRPPGLRRGRGAILNPRHRLKALMTKQCGAKYSGQDNHPNCRPQAKSFAGFDEDSNFGDRHANENEGEG